MRIWVQCFFFRYPVDVVRTFGTRKTNLLLNRGVCWKDTFHCGGRTQPLNGESVSDMLIDLN